MDQEDWAEDFRAVLLCPVPGLYGTCLRLYRAQVLPRSSLCPDTSPLLRLCSYVVCIFRSVPIKCTCICEVRGQLQAYFRSQLQLFFGWLVLFCCVRWIDFRVLFVFCFFPGIYQFGRFAGQWVSGSFCPLAFYLGSEDLNSWLHSYATSTLLKKVLSPVWRLPVRLLGQCQRYQQP